MLSQLSEESVERRKTFQMSGGQYVTYVQDLEQEPFDAIDLVEKLAWRMTGSAQTINDPVSLKTRFEEEIGSLQMLCDQFQVIINSDYSNIKILF